MELWLFMNKWMLVLKIEMNVSGIKLTCREFSAILSDFQKQKFFVDIFRPKTFLYGNKLF